MLKPKFLLIVFGLAVVTLSHCAATAAQEVRVVTSDGEAVIVTSEAGGSPFSAAPHGSPGRPESKPEEGKPDDDKPDKEEGESDKDEDKEEGEDKDDEKSKDDEPKAPEPITRSSEPPEPPDPEELKIRPDADGMIRFSFTGQPWQGVLQWLADVSGMSLDWQELPGDYLNLTTQRSYSLEEARDLINRHLRARGYTLLRHGEIFSVAKLEGLDAGMVPRVDPEELDDRDPHEFVKVSFPLDWLLAQTAVEELKPMLSPHGKLNPLTTTNRLEAIDAVINLLEIRRLLMEEQSTEAQEGLFEEFLLEYAKADDVREQVLGLLGVDSKPKVAMPMSPQQMQQMQQMQEQARRQAQQQQQKGGAPAQKEQAQVNLVVNRRRNSILAHAPPDKMAIIRQAVEALDVPTGTGDSLLVSMHRMQIYRLAAIDPEPLVKTLDALGELDPKTRLEVDRENRAIIAYATAADHVVIRALIDQLDGSGRRFDVIPLRLLQADYVAGTVQFMLSGPEEEEPRYSRYYGYGSSRDRSSNDKKDAFRVDADVENNRLLLWANDIEIEEVRNLLVKLGEIPPDERNLSTVRVLDGTWDPETEAWLERVRHAWPSVGANPLELHDEASARPDETDADETLQAPAPAEDVEARSPDRQPSESSPTASRPGVSVIRLAQLHREETIEEPAAETGPVAETAIKPAVEPPGEPGARPDVSKPQPIRITRGPDGRVVITSDDTQALDLLEDLMNRLAPPRNDYEIFRLKYAWAYGVALTLEDIFEEEEEDSGGRSPYWYYYDYDDRRNDKDDKRRLSNRRPLKFISDPDSNSILVQNADPGQLAKIRELIEFYDQPEPVDSQSVRKMQIVKLKHAKAITVAEAIKDVYRDLLSSNDKALMNGQQRGPERSYTFVYDADAGQQERAPRFKGLLSIGIHELANTLVISAPVHLLEDVVELIDDIDEAAMPTSEAVHMHQVAEGVDAGLVREKLERLLGQRRGTGAPNGQPNRPVPQGAPRPNGRPER